MNYISVGQAAEQWGISDRCVRVLCGQGEIPGVVREMGGLTGFMRTR